MKVKFKQAWARVHPELTPNNIYRVIAISHSYYRIMCDVGQPILCIDNAFHVVDPSPDPIWHTIEGSEGELYVSPNHFEAALFDRWFDRDRAAQTKLLSYLLDCCEMDAEKSPDLSRFVSFKVDGMDMYSELDEEGCEIRKLLRRSDGEWWYVDAKGTAQGDLRLTRVELPTDYKSLSRETFESLWGSALPS